MDCVAVAVGNLATSSVPLFIALAAMAIDVEPAAVSLPSAPTVNVATDEAEP
jgi:hypothetical protein